MQNILTKFKWSASFNLLFRNVASMTLMKPKSNHYLYRSSSSLFNSSKYYMSTHQINHKNLTKSVYDGQGYHVEQLFAGCLAIYSYYIESGNDCFLVDPLFDNHQYNELIKQRGKTLKGIFVTHYHADYVSGQYELQKKHGCKIYMGPNSMGTDSVVSVKDKETLKLGNVTLQFWHTPGHTQESSCLVVKDSTGKSDTIFTGDTLFLNEVGRPDLAVKTNLTAQQLAEKLFDSLQKLKTLNNDIKIYPGHGSGSACGKSIGAGDVCTLGTQKQNNYGLKANNKESFVKQVLQDMPKPPSYFGYNAKLNKFEPFFYEQASKKVHRSLKPEEVYELSKQEDVIIVDIRSTGQLLGGYLDKSILIGFDGGFATWVGTLLNPSDKIILFGTDQQVKQAIPRLFRIGYINILGHASFSIKQWKKLNLPVIVPEFVDQIVQPDTVILDVRKPEEWKSDGVVEGSIRMQLTDLFNHPQKLDKSKVYVTHCKSGYRAKIAYSFLLDSGFKAKAYPHPFATIFNSGKAKKVQL